MRCVYQRPAARRDLIEHYVYLGENAGEETAERFLAQAEHTFTDLAENREMGTNLTLRDQRLAGLRKWRVKDFGKFLIFYFPRSACRSFVSCTPHKTGGRNLESPKRRCGVTTSGLMVVEIACDVIAIYRYQTTIFVVPSDGHLEIAGVILPVRQRVTVAGEYLLGVI